jgi:NADPH:quinone reductase-like Zn-dependent oxidoreductase
MLAARLQADGIKVENLPQPVPGEGELLIRVHAAAITRDELTWPVDRLPAIPSYEVSGVVAAAGPDVDGFGEGEEVSA